VEATLRLADVGDHKNFNTGSEVFNEDFSKFGFAVWDLVLWLWVLIECFDAPAKAEEAFVDVRGFIDIGYDFIGTFAAGEINDAYDNFTCSDTKDGMWSRTFIVEFSLGLGTIKEILFKFFLEVRSSYLLRDFMVLEI
jgi:hypothetical protein